MIGVLGTLLFGYTLLRGLRSGNVDAPGVAGFSGGNRKESPGMFWLESSTMGRFLRVR
jgi:hypothetical protein